MPAELRDSYNDLMACAKKRNQDGWIISYTDYGRHRYPIDPNLTGDDLMRRRRNVRQQAKEAIARIIEWENSKDGVTLAGLYLGTQIDGKNVPSTYSLPILELVQAVLLEFPRHAKKRNGMRRAAETVLQRNQIDLAQPAKRSRKMTPVTPETYLKSAISLGQKYAELLGDKSSAYDKLADEFRRLADEAKWGVITPHAAAVKSPSDHPQPLTYVESQRGGSVGGYPSPVDTPPEQIQLDVPPCDSFDSLPTGLAGPEAATIQDDGMVLLGVLADVGAEPDQVLLLDDTKPTDEKLQRSINYDFRGFTENIEDLKVLADARQWSLVVRFRGPVLQCDDCDAETVELLRPFALAAWETSPGNYQAWLAFNDEEDKETTAPKLWRGVRSILPNSTINKGSGGATRWIGTHNFKPERKQEGGQFPVVQLLFLNRGRIVTPTELDDAGLLVSESERTEGLLLPELDSTGVWWPSYDLSLAGAPVRQNGAGRDISRADASFVTRALLAGSFSILPRNLT